MTSSTTRAFMAKKQSTSFAQVATNLLNLLQGYTKTIRLLLVMFVTLSVSAEVWGAEYTFSNIPTKGWSTKGGSQTINNLSWIYSSATYIGVNNSRIQVGSSNNPQTSNWTIQIPISNFGTNIKITKVAITAYTTATTATYDISVSGSSVKNGNLTTSSATYSSSTLNATTGNIVVTLKGSNNSKAMYLSNIIVTYETAAATKLATPTNLKVADVTTTSATLSWDAVTNASGYTVTVGSTPYSANTNSISLNSLTPSTTYKWSVVAKGNGSTYTDSESAKGSDFTTDTPQRYTVTWMVDKETLSTEDVYENGKVSSVPTVTELPCGDKFVGWTTDPIAKPQNEAPDVFTTVADSPIITKSTTFYAVFADYEQ